MKEPPPRPPAAAASHSGVPQAPAGAPPAKSPTVRPPPSGDSQGNLAMVVSSASAASSGQVASALQAWQDPWSGWHPGLLGRSEASGNPAPPLSQEGQRRATQRTGPSAWYCRIRLRQCHRSRRPRRPDPDIRDLMPSALERLQPEAWNYIGWFQGCPYALLQKVGHSGSLPPVHGMADMPRLREKRARTLAKEHRVQRRMLLCVFAASVHGRTWHTLKT